MSLWPLALGLGSAALAASTLMVPAARRLSFGSVAFDWLGQELELDRIDPDGMTVRTKAGTLMAPVGTVEAANDESAPQAEPPMPSPITARLRAAGQS